MRYSKGRDDKMDNFYIVLVRPQYPVNIGLIARTMKNFDFQNLRIVSPLCNIFSEMSLRLSHNSRDILCNSEIYSDLESAISDINIVLSATARKRKYQRQSIKIENIWEKLSELEMLNSIAFVFGNEETGLTNDDLRFSHYNIRIPSSGKYPSLNLAQSVGILLYEIFVQKQQISKTNILSKQKLASSAEMQGFYCHMEDIYSKLGFFKERDHTRMMDLIFKIFKKADLTSTEIRLLRGILSQTDWYINKGG